MQETLGIILAMMMSGQGLPDILRGLGGAAGTGSVGIDGLASLRRQALVNAKVDSPLMQDPSTINRASELFLDRLGVNPYTGPGQGATALLSGLYHMFPGTLGTIMGVPDRGSFFTSIANGAYGINMAAGYGVSNRFDGGSVLEVHKRAMDMAKISHELGINKNGGYDVSYSHGLNFSEMGVVAQRLMSSSMPYMDYTERNGAIDPSSPTGRLDMDKDADKFRRNMKYFGEKVNGLVSMVNKVTGSMEETMKLLDGMAGGNFLGGSVKDMESVSGRAMKMAASLRVAASISGESPTALFANWRDLQRNMVSGMGMNPYIADATGMSSLMTDMAYTGTAAYGFWAAKHPNASLQEKQMALISANARAQSYMNTSGSKLAAAVAANHDMFTEEQRRRVVESFRNGRPNDVASMVREVLGSEMYGLYMTDPAFQLMARKRASDEHGDFLREVDRAGFSGNLLQAQREGNRIAMNAAVESVGERLGRMTGERGFSSRTRKASLDGLRSLARRNGFLDESALKKMGIQELRDLLSGMTGFDAGSIDEAEIGAMESAAIGRIDELTMKGGEEDLAKSRLYKEIDASGWDEKRKSEMRLMADDGNFDKVFGMLSYGKSARQQSDMRRRVTGGRLFRSQANTEKLRVRLSRSKYNTMLAAGSIDMAAVLSAAEKIGVMDIGKLTDTQLDDILNSDINAANKIQNRFSNLLAEGDGSYAREAVKETRSNLEKLAGMLRSNGDFADNSDIQEVASLAFGTEGEGLERGDALKRLKAAIGDGEDGKYNMALLRAAYGTKVGAGNTGLDYVLGMVDNASDDEILNITRNAARESSAADIGKILGDLVQNFAKFISEPESFFTKGVGAINGGEGLKIKMY